MIAQRGPASCRRRTRPRQRTILSQPDRSSVRKIWPTTARSSRSLCAARIAASRYRSTAAMSGAAQTIRSSTCWKPTISVHPVRHATKAAPGAGGAEDRCRGSPRRDRRSGIFDVPIERLISKDYAKRRRAEIDPQRAGAYTSKVLSNESANTTHVTIADGDGNIVTSTQTINSLFGARLVIPGNRHHSQQLHVPVRSAFRPGAVVDTGQAHHEWHLGADRQEGGQAPSRWPAGAHRIPSCVLQAVLNIVDHGMSVQEVVEAPRVFSWGLEAEVERGFRRACAQNSPREDTMSFRSIMSLAACAPSPSRRTAP